MPETTISNLPDGQTPGVSATTPLDGTERVPMDQGETTVDATTQDIADLADPAIAAAITAHEAEADPHIVYALKTDLGDAAALDVGTTAGTVAAGDDGRLSDSRTPTTHKTTHATGGSDELTPADIGAEVAGAAAAVAGTLAPVATSGVYGDLTGLPTLGTAAATDTTAYATSAQGGLADSAVQPDDLATVATTGAYADLSGSPTLGTAAAEDVGTASGNVVQLDGSGRLPAVDGSLLTNLPAAVGALDDLSDVDLTTTPPGDGEALVYDDDSGNWVPGAAGASAAGAVGDLQFNNGTGGLGASADLNWDDTGKVLDVGGDINLDDGGANQTTLQLVTPTAARTITFPDATGTVGLVAGSTGQLVFNLNGAYSGLSGVTTDGTDITLTGRFISSLNGAASAPPGTFTGTWFTGGTSTTTKPQVLIEPTGTTSTAWSTSGTGLGVNAASGFAGNLLDLQVNGSSRFKFDVANKRFHLFTDGTRGDAYFDRGGGGGDPRFVGTNGTFDFVFTGLSRSVVAQGSFAVGTDGGTPPATNGSVLAGNSLNFYSRPTIGNSELVGGPRSANVDEVAQHFVISTRARNAGTSAWTNTSGGHLYLLSGNAASAATNAANGGNIYLDGGIGYGTGTNGNIIIGATRGNLQITDARDVILGTTTGTKIGTATTQKLGFYNATPVVQPAAVADITTTATAGTLPTPDGSVTVADADAPTNAELLEYCVELEAKLEAALGHLRTLGLIAT
jgi:hypothetical protein